MPPRNSSGRSRTLASIRGGAKSKKGTGARRPSRSERSERKKSSTKRASTVEPSRRRRHKRRSHKYESDLSDYSSEDDSGFSSEDDRHHRRRSGHRRRSRGTHVSKQTPPPQGVPQSSAAASTLVAPNVDVSLAVEASKAAEEAAVEGVQPLKKDEVEEDITHGEVTQAIEEAASDAIVQASDIIGVPEEDADIEDVSSHDGGAGSSKGGRREVAPGTGGDYGAAYKELYTAVYIRMVGRIYRFFQKLYVKCGNNEARFKQKLSEVPKWNQQIIDEKTREFIKVHPSIVQYFKFAYAANVMLMSVVVQRDANSTDVTVDVPKFTEFVHRCYSESARSIYDCSAVLDPSLPADKRLSIREELYTCFGNAIGTSLRIMVPLENLVPTPEGEQGDEDEEARMGTLEGFEDFGLSSDDEGPGDDEGTPLPMRADKKHQDHMSDDSGEGDEDSEDEESEDDSDEEGSDEYSDLEDDDDSDESEDDDESEEEEEEAPRKRQPSKKKKLSLSKSQLRPDRKIPKEEREDLAFF